MVRLRAGTGVRLGGCRQAYGMVALFLPVPVERTALGEPVHLAEIGRIDVPRRRVPPRCARQRHEGVGVDPGPEIRRLPGERERIADVPLILGAGLRAHDDVVVEPAADVLQPPQVPLDVGASHGERVEVLAGAPGPTRCATVSHRGSGRVTAKTDVMEQGLTNHKDATNSFGAAPLTPLHSHATGPGLTGDRRLRGGIGDTRRHGMSEP
jgi:hypothetical protein